MDEAIRPVIPPIPAPDADPEAILAPVLARLRDGFRREPMPSAAVRRDRLDRLDAMVRSNRERIAAAAHVDFGHRAATETELIEIAPLLAEIRHARAHLGRWMRPERRGKALEFFVLKNRVLYQPLGVIGILSPWNYPLLLSLGPLVDVLAAGNRAMLKPSELSPQVSALLAEMIEANFAADEVAVVTGGADIGAAFAGLAFDHLVFTGSTAVGRKVMAAAAPNLTPLTLELGGKSPALIAPGAAIGAAAKAIAFGKFLNAGQTCIAPDYVLVPEAEREALVAALLGRIAEAYPVARSGRDYTSLISPRHAERLRGALAEAEARGARLLQPPGFVLPPSDRALVPTLVLDLPDDTLLAREEIFGPVLPIFGYGHLDDALARIAGAGRPLAFYLFSQDAALAADVLARTRSGNVTLNSTILHIAQNELPFGGIGPSGMGAYHGQDGFRRFSHARGVTAVSFWDPSALGSPPYGRLAKVIAQVIGRR